MEDHTKSWPPWTESETGLPDPLDEVLVEAGAFRHVSQIVIKETKGRRIKPPYWIASGTGMPFFINGTRWVPLPPHRLDEGKT